MAGSITDLVRGMVDLRRSVLPVAVTAVGGVAVYAFLKLAGEMQEGELAGFDRAVLLAFRNPADPTDPLGAIVVGYLVVARRYGPALFVALSVGLGTLVGQLLKLAYDRPRPDVVNHLVAIHTASFPSGHATMSTLVYLTLAALIARLVEDWRVLAYVICVAVLLSLAVGLRLRARTGGNGAELPPNGR